MNDGNEAVVWAGRYGCDEKGTPLIVQDIDRVVLCTVYCVASGLVLRWPHPGLDGPISSRSKSAEKQKEVLRRQLAITP